MCGSEISLSKALEAVPGSAILRLVRLEDLFFYGIFATMPLGLFAGAKKLFARDFLDEGDEAPPGSLGPKLSSAEMIRRSSF